MNNPFSLKNILTLIPLFTACLYVMGWNYFQSYIGAFGLEGSQFPISTNENLISGAIAVALIGIKSMTTLAIVCWTLLIIFWIFIFIYLSSIWDRLLLFFARVLPQPDSIEVKRQPPEKLFNAINQGGNLLLLYIFFMSLLIVIFYTSSYLGKNAALDKINTYPNTKLAHLDLGNQVYKKAMPIQCSQTHCAYWLGDKAVILKHSDVKQHFAYPKK